MLNAFLTLCQVSGMDNTTALHYGEIVASLYKKGKPIPTNDVWIAALAIQNDFTLITRDKHFKEIDSLKVKNW